MDIQKIAALIEASSGCSLDAALAHARFVADLTLPLDYAPWRHGGWYVGNVRYPNGAVGCVSRNYPDRRWRIACDARWTASSSMAGKTTFILAGWTGMNVAG